MSNDKIKSENYSNMGGINNKISPYDTGPMEFLDMSNLDFQQPGALSQRWGSTMYVGQTFNTPITSLYEFTKLDGSSYVVFGLSGGLWAGATTGNSKGTSLTNFGATQASYNWFPVFKTYSALGPVRRYQGVNSPPPYLGVVPFYDNFNAIIAGGDVGSTYLIINNISFSSNKYDFVTFQNYLFAANGNQFVKFDGSTLYFVGVPPCLLTNVDKTTTSGFTQATSGVGVSFGQIGFYGSFVNNRGVEGEIWPLALMTGEINAGPTFQSGLSYVNGVFDINTPLGFGLSSINIYSYWAASGLIQGFGSSSLEGAAPIESFWNLNYTFYQSIPASGSTTTQWVFSNSPDATGNAGAVPASPDYSILNLTTSTTLGQSIAGITMQTITHFNLTNYCPQYLELYQNRLFLAGFSSTPSTIWFSDTGEPEGYFADSNIEVRTNDGDYITSLKSYSTRLYILKLNSFYALYGDNPTNFYLQEISHEYGCMNNRCAIVYDDIFLFLDRKGVVQYNGANIQVISTKVQAIFDSMNFSAALTEACMEHDKLRNQIVISIPINGSTTNNVMVVYDYLVGAWTTYNGPTVSALRAIQGRNNTKNLFYGSYTGTINWFGTSFLSDNGTGFTTYFKTKFLKPLGDSMQEQYRRLYMNANTYGSTLILNINFYADYGASIVLGRTMVITDYQKRIDYGICATSLSFEMANIQTSQVFRMYGFTVESRLQRRISGK